MTIHRDCKQYAVMTLITAIVWAVLNGAVFGADGTVAHDIAAKADEYLAAHADLLTFNGSVLIAQKGQVLLNKGYGLANREHNVPNTPQTKFRIGSITKQFTAMAIMQMQEKGMLKVEEPVATYLPDFPNGKKFTVHHLLTHTSGLKSFTGFPDYLSTMMIPSPPEKTLERFKELPLEFDPGEKYAYCNSGYVLLGHLIETLTADKYENVLQEQIFSPLEMNDTGYDRWDSILERRASGYIKENGQLKNALYIDMSIPHAAGALYSTVEDLYKWDRALYTEKLLPKPSMDKMFTPFKDGYAYGWLVGDLFGHKRIEHSGGINGFVTNISRFVDDDVCIIVLSNFEHADTNRLIMDLSAIVFGEKYEMPKKVAEAR